MAVIRYFLIAGLAVFLALDSAAQAQVNPDYPPQPAMFVLQDKDSTLHLFGSAHLIKPDVEWRTTIFNEALARADEIWLEATFHDMIDPDMHRKMMKAGFDPLHSLSDRLSAEEYKRVEDLGNKLDLQINTLDHLRPWAVAMLLPDAKAEYDKRQGNEKTIKINPGVEDIVQTMSLGRPIKSIEDVDSHMMLFSSLSESDEIKHLMNVVEELEKSKPQEERFNSIMKAWSSGDLATLERLGNEEMRKTTPGLYDAMIIKRNRKITDSIVREMNGRGNDVVIVGAAHLAGPDNIPDMLRKMGYRVDRVYDETAPVASTTNRDFAMPGYRQVREIPRYLNMRLKADPGGDADIVMLNMSVPLAVSGCAQVSPIEYRIQYGGDAFDILTAGYYMTMNVHQQAACGAASKAITVNIPLKLSQIRKQKITKLRLWFQGQIDTYGLALTEDSLTITPPRKIGYYRVSGNKPVALPLPGTKLP